jgi:hypothetical protein
MEVNSMKIIASVVALATLIALPTVSDAASKKSKARHAHATRHTVVVPSRQRGYETRRAHSSNPQWDVYRNSEYVGSDPDPNVRNMLQRDDTFNDQ